MPFLGPKPTSGFTSTQRQTITGTGVAVYSLDAAVANENDLEVFVNNVRQRPGDAYTASGTTITFSENITAQDEVYIVFQGKAIANKQAPIAGTAQTGTVTIATSAELETGTGVFDKVSLTNDVKGYIDANDIGTGTNQRNVVLTPDPVSTGSATQTGFSSTIYTGNGTSQSINTGVDMATGTNGGLVWVKDRGAASSHYLASSIQDTGSVINYLRSNDANPEGNSTNVFTSFDSTGFSVGSNGVANANTNNFVSWSWQTTKKIEPTLGAELVTNGTFDTDVSGWTAAESTGGTASSLSLSSNRIRVTNTGATYGAAYQTITTEIGKVYQVSVDIFIGTSALAVAWATNATPINTAGGESITTAASRNFTFSFRATQTSTIIAVSNNNESGAYNEFDNISVKEITNGVYTNKDNSYSAHYNPDLGFSIVAYQGSTEEGHDIPHHLGKEPELSFYKERTKANLNWLVTGKYIGDREAGSYLGLNTTNAVADNPVYKNIVTDTHITLDKGTGMNLGSEFMISYHFTSVPGVSKIGKYVGTGAAGNYVDCGFRAGWLLIKNISTGTTNWWIVDGKRNIADGLDSLYANTNAVEAANTNSLNFSDTGFYITTTASELNTANDEYLFMAFAETSTDATRSWTDYDYETSNSELTINSGTALSFANGFDAQGALDNIESVGNGVTVPLGAGFEDKTLWVYKDRAGSYGVTENRPLTGVSRAEADTWGIVSPVDPTLRTTAKHFGYESTTGVASASGEFSGRPAWRAFDKDNNDIIDGNAIWQVTSTTNSWLQYKFNEPRILKSWRLRVDTSARAPRRFTIEGSNDGLNWTAIDSTYTASDLTVSDDLWISLQDTSANVTPYIYHRINITANNGDVSETAIAELEFNTVSPADYYNVEDGVVYNLANTPLERVYIAKVKTDTNGDIFEYTPWETAKTNLLETEVHKDLKVRGEIHNKGICTAWVSFDGTQDPPLIKDSYNVADVVKAANGEYNIIFENSMDNPGYSVGATCEYIGGSGLISAAMTKDSKPKTVNEFRVTLVVEAGNTVDRSDVNVQVFGGKD